METKLVVEHFGKTKLKVVVLSRVDGEGQSIGKDVNSQL
jgi:hypothetical protein